ncbi:hypothetical protein EV667_3901 [Ancylobacter aquaticus]|uniref:Uncharacterized protein n=1 Tax=Ancylobacter aquaticus TaxID=100 RepID=A0A4R1HPZ2_ANCAQ|nr:hypothetical protein [Ancylobacter aquaticus]TCK23223.1 hypothetical protein EV667_3901 [Ancylobacter aquaticus]
MTAPIPPWTDVAWLFEPDGASRDIYVLDAGPDGWQDVLDGLRALDPSPVFEIDGEPAALPPRIEDVFAVWESASPRLRWNTGEVLVTLRFFRSDDIEFDIDPADVDTPEDWQALARFMLWLAEKAERPVVLTPENIPDDILLFCRTAQDGIELNATPEP